MTSCMRIAALCALAGPASATPVQETDPGQTRYIVNGQVGGPTYVMALVWRDPDTGDGAVFCSATLVTSQWLLTAAHCIEAMTGSHAGMEIHVSTRERIYQETWHGSMVIFTDIHPDYLADSSQSDIGLIQIADPLWDFGFAHLNDKPLTDAWIGTSLMFVGYGVTSDDATDSGTRRKAIIPTTGCLDGSAHNQLNCADDAATNLLSRHPSRNVCSGDSGGAALEYVNGLWRLISVNSAVTPQCVDGSNISVRIDKHLPWIQDYIADEDLNPPDTGQDTGSSGDPFVPPEEERQGLCATSGTGPTSVGWLSFALLMLCSRRCQPTLNGT